MTRTCLSFHFTIAINYGLLTRKEERRSTAKGEYDPWKQQSRGSVQVNYGTIHDEQGTHPDPERLPHFDDYQAADKRALCHLFRLQPTSLPHRHRWHHSGQPQAVQHQVSGERGRRDSLGRSPTWSNFVTFESQIPSKFASQINQMNQN